MSNEKLIEVIEELIKLLENSSCEEEQDEDEIPSEVESLCDDFNAFLKWAFGKSACTLTEARKLWKKHHPDLEVPRILKIDVVLPYRMETALVLDAYPLYLESKKNH